MTKCGIDEAGRGALAGPLVGAAVVFGNKKSAGIEKYLKDSKLLSHRQRLESFAALADCGAVWVVEEISVEEINRRGMGWANKELFRRLTESIEADEYILDGNLEIKTTSGKGAVRSLIKADAVVPEVMAASIVAKVSRDKMMGEMAKDYWMYGWERNKGYGTAEHIRALLRIGMTQEHRNQFVRTAIDNIKFFSRS